MSTKKLTALERMKQINRETRGTSAINLADPFDQLDVQRLAIIFLCEEVDRLEALVERLTAGKRLN